MLLNNSQAPNVIGLEIENSPEQGTFARFEQKYFLPKENAAQFKDEILKHMSPSYPKAGTKFTGVESVYFDSPDFKIYQMHFSTQQKRFKIRARRYAPDGILDDNSVHLELKSKEAGLSRKTRFQISLGELKTLSYEGIMPSSSRSLMARNRGLTARRLGERIDQINALVSQNELRPSCIVRYRREAFEGEALRLTIDDQIDFESARRFPEIRSIFRSNSALNEAAGRMRSTFQGGDYLLVEVKHPGTVPAGLTDILLTNGCRKAKFSKYCYSVTNALLREEKSSHWAFSAKK
jgi:SPX domain protein involved in polyphosphate accumulation